METASTPPPSLRRRSTQTSTRETQTPAEQDTSSSIEPAKANADPSQQPAEGEVKRCWVCMGDETDESPEEHRIWRSPCPCSLRAHEDCLLEWVADKETPHPGKLAHNYKIQCPQCQAEIKVERPQEMLVSWIQDIHMIARLAVIPAAIGAAAGSIYTGFLVYGENTMGVVFGIKEADAILQPLLKGPSFLHALFPWHVPGVDFSRSAAIQAALFSFIPRFRGAGGAWYFLGLPAIGPGLVLLRTKYAEMWAVRMLVPVVRSLPASFLQTNF